MSDTYSHEDIKVMEEIEHIRKHPGMYIGETINPNHLVYELLDNALDEAQAGHASLIGLDFNTKDNVVSIADNGRGIPFQNNTIPTIATKLFSGGKFSKGKDGVYKIASGLHGVGIVAVTALSDNMTIQVYRDKKHASYEFKDAKVINESIDNYTNKKKPFSTQITFSPSKNHFDTVKFDLEKIRKRLKIASVHIPKLKLIMFVDGNREIINCNLESFFKSDVLSDEFHCNQFSPMIQLEEKINDESVKIKFCWNMTGTSTPKSMGCVNILQVDQGTHINRTNDLIRNVLYQEAQKDKLNFNKNDCLAGLRCYTTVMLYETSYSSQTKEKLSVSKSKLDHLYIPLEKKLIEFFKNNSDLRNILLSHFDNYRKGLDSKKKIIKTSGSTVSRLNTVIDSKLRDCTSTDISRTELFITEGNSAAGSLLQCRNPKYHALLALRGKIPNIADAKKDFLKNKEIVDIINAIGTGIGNDFSLNRLRYNSIVIATDSDKDGFHIAVLLMIMFIRTLPELVKNGHLYLAQLPLYGSEYKGKFYPIQSNIELEEFKKKYPNANIQRYKGLGEMNPSQLKVCLLDNTRKLIKIEYPEDEKALLELLTSSTEKRKLV